MTSHNPQEAPETTEPHSTQDPTGKGPGRGGEVGMMNGWGLTRNMRGVRRVTDAKRIDSPVRWKHGWQDAKGFIPDGCFFESRADAIRVARRYAEGALKNAQKMRDNAENDLAKLDILAEKPE